MTDTETDTETTETTETYWGCFVCAAAIPEPQVYCSAACREAEEGER